MNGIDIASYQEGIDLGVVPADFVIVKATGGTGYTNPDFWRAADQALATGKKLGIYHYARDHGYEGSAAQEAAFFLSAFAPYKGKAIPMLDWEADALFLPIEWAREWLDIVARETGATPFFYSGASYINNTDCSLITSYPLWKASYLSRYAGGGYVEDPVDLWGHGAWSATKIYQYTSEGRLPGWGSNLDLDKFYGISNDWKRFCGEEARQEPGEPKNDAGLAYFVHSADLGDLPPVRDGQTAGTTGAALRMEGITFTAIPEGWKLLIKLHLQDAGWKSYDVKPGELCGTKGESRRIEMLQVDVLERPKGDKRKLHYQVHQEGYGWLGETLEGFATGCDGQGRRLEAVKLWLE